jgi:hypothetical protein
LTSGNIIFVLEIPEKVCYNNNKVENKRQKAVQTESGKNRNSADLICRSCPSEAKQERGSEQWQDLHYQEIYTTEKVL